MATVGVKGLISRRR